jgi:hypothetical protein
MKLRTILLVFLILASVSIAVATAKADGAGDSTGQQVRSGNQTQDQIRDRQMRERNETETLETHTQERNRTHEQLSEQERLQNQTRAMNGTLLHQQIQERKLEQEQEWTQLSAEQRNVNARYSNVSAFVHLLLNESRAEALLGNRSGGIGSNVSAFAREFNSSIRAQIQAEERIEDRNGFVRFIAGGDDEAAAELENETATNQERIAAMQQLIQEYQGGDPEIKAAFQEQLQQIEAQQTEVRQRAIRECNDKGILGWLWK